MPVPLGNGTSWRGTVTGHFQLINKSGKVINRAVEQRMKGKKMKPGKAVQFHDKGKAGTGRAVGGYEALMEKQRAAQGRMAQTKEGKARLKAGKKALSAYANRRVEAAQSPAAVKARSRNLSRMRQQRAGRNRRAAGGARRRA